MVFSPFAAYTNAFVRIYIWFDESHHRAARVNCRGGQSAAFQSYSGSANSDYSVMAVRYNSAAGEHPAKSFAKMRYISLTVPLDGHAESEYDSVTITAEPANPQTGPCQQQYGIGTMLGLRQNINLSWPPFSNIQQITIKNKRLKEP